MATVAPEVRGAQPAPTPPVRHGTCRLIVIIDGTEYRLSRSPSARAAWHLKRLAEPRKGTTYCVLTHKSIVMFSCPYIIMNGVVCKHVRALVAVGLVSKRAKPEAIIVAETKGADHAYTNSAAPLVGGGAPDLWERLAAPFAAEEVRTRRGPRGDLRYITARTARRRLNEVVGPANWSCRIEPADRWVRCALTIVLPDGRQLTREALGGYPDMPTDDDKVKGGDSDAFKRACVLFGIGEYLYGDEPAEPAEPAEPRPATRPAPTSNGDGRGEPRNVPRDRISFPDARAFYGWLKDNGHLALADEIGNREDLPVRIIHWTPAQIDAATLEILDRTSHAR